MSVMSLAAANLPQSASLPFEVIATEQEDLDDDDCDYLKVAATPAAMPRIHGRLK